LNRQRSNEWLVTLSFLAIVSSASLLQTAIEISRGQRPGALEIFDQPPSAANLRAFEKDLENASLAVRRLRPWMQLAQFALLSDAGEKVVVGHDGWLFYRPGLLTMTQRPPVPAQDPYPAIKSFHDQLQARGIHLIVLPVPNKESVHPEQLSRRADQSGVIKTRRLRALLDRLQAAGIEFVDLFELFDRAQRADTRINRQALYLYKDTHWSPAGMKLAAEAVARRIIERRLLQPGTTAYDERQVPLERPGDLIEMLQSPPIDRAVAPERLSCSQVIERDTGRPYHDAPGARVLILGDSFLRMYERDEPTSAGLIAHLARELRQPLSSIINDGGASTLVRQDLARRPRLLADKSLVIWEFVERDIVDGTEGWQIIPLSDPR
jgi:hypothetical protein